MERSEKNVETTYDAHGPNVHTMYILHAFQGTCIFSPGFQRTQIQQYINPVTFAAPGTL